MDKHVEPEFNEKQSLKFRSSPNTLNNSSPPLSSITSLRIIKRSPTTSTKLNSQRKSSIVTLLWLLMVSGLYSFISWSSILGNVTSFSNTSPPKTVTTTLTTTTSVGGYINWGSSTTVTITSVFTERVYTPATTVLYTVQKAPPPQTTPAPVPEPPKAPPRPVDPKEKEIVCALARNNNWFPHCNLGWKDGYYCYDVVYQTAIQQQYSLTCSQMQSIQLAATRCRQAQCLGPEFINAINVYLKPVSIQKNCWDSHGLSFP